MQQHPVPQNVTGYEFHLIGQMTLKQFMEVAAGILVAVLINWTNLPEIVKYPLMGIAGLTGLALAFIPLGGRPLDRWFFAFIKSIYQPTLFYWKKTETIPEIFNYTQPLHVDNSPQVDYKPLRQSRVQEFLTTLPQEQTQQAPSAEDAQVQHVLSLFSSNPPPLPTPVPIQTDDTSFSPPTPPSSQDQLFAGPRVIEMKIEEQGLPKPELPKQKQEDLPRPVTLQQTNSQIAYSTHAGIALDEVSSPLPLQNTQVPQVEKRGPLSFEDVSPVQTDTSLPFPTQPTIPNVIVGMVLTNDKKIIDNAIVTIVRESDSTPVRALKTNMLGQFEIVTPLENGSYMIVTEKEGFTFANKSLELHQQIIEPLIIQAM